MKKLTLSLALILCLVLSAFVFASCGKDKAKSTTAATTVGNAECAHEWNTEYTIDTPATCARVGSKSIHCVKCGAQKPGSVEEVEKLAHTESADYIVDLEPNCSENGYKSKHCTVCGAIIDSTIETIDADPAKHVVEEWETVEPTLLSNGTKTGTCTLCHLPISEEVEETYVEWTYTTETGTVHSYTKNLGDLLLSAEDELHFYPTAENPAGLDYRIEYSFLWNPSLLKMSSNNNTQAQVLTASIGDQDTYWMALTTNAYDTSNKVAPGGFEFIACRTVEYGPAGMSQLTATGGKVGTTYADFPNIGGTTAPDLNDLNNGHEWGWHRLAFVVHQDLLNEDAVKNGDNASYRMTYTCYVDGVKIYTLSNRSDPAFNASTYRAENMLFKAEADGAGGINYTDTGKSATWVKIPATKTVEGNAYAVFADEAVFVGNDFAQKVVKVTNPAANVYVTEDGTEINAPIWYRLADD